jgi:hypothetical protein
LHQALPLARVLPVGKADFLHNVVNVRDDAFDDDVGIFAFGFIVQATYS